LASGETCTHRASFTVVPGQRAAFDRSMNRATSPYAAASSADSQSVAHAGRCHAVCVAAGSRSLASRVFLRGEPHHRPLHPGVSALMWDARGQHTHQTGRNEHDRIHFGIGGRCPLGRFTGSGSEYFRIWIVNLLLMLVTLGFYFPYAKVRRLRYFHANTLVDGQALGFHGDPRKMMRGYVLMLVLAGLYGVAGKVSPVSGLIALLVLAGLWPALWRASLQFRLANTSWRGLRLRFDGDLPGAYSALWVL
jgi:hypothetical protein